MQRTCCSLYTRAARWAAAAYDCMPMCIGSFSYTRSRLASLARFLFVGQSDVRRTWPTEWELVELSCLRGLCTGKAPALMNLMFWGSCQSLHWWGYSLYFAITDSILRLGIYDPNKYFHCILSSEQVSNKSATFILTNWGKKHYNKSR